MRSSKEKRGFKGPSVYSANGYPNWYPHSFLSQRLLVGSSSSFPEPHQASTGRLKWLEYFLPLPVLEISHFLGSLTGMGLLLLARGLQRRLDAAYVLTLVLLGAGAVFSLLKGLDYEEAIVLTDPVRGPASLSKPFLSEGLIVRSGLHARLDHLNRRGAPELYLAGTLFSQAHGVFWGALVALHPSRGCLSVSPGYRRGYLPGAPFRGSQTITTCLSGSCLLLP